MEKLNITIPSIQGNQSSQKENQPIEYSFCEEHGKFEKHRTHFNGKQVEQTCPDCRDIEIVKKQREEKEAEKKRQIDYNYYRSNIPKRFRGIDIKTIDVSYHKSEKHNKELIETIKTVEGYLNTYSDRANLGSSGFFCGECGTGKTMLACIMVEYIINQGYSAQYITAWQMIQNIRQGYGKTEESISYFIDKYINKSFLVIDEVGVQHGTDDERILLYQVIDGRYNDMKPTVIISNSKDPVKDGYLDLRTIDRLKEGGGFSIIFNGESYRK